MGRLRIPANITFNRDNWVHDIIIEKEINEEIEYPLCIKAKSGAYPEDCGGTHMDMKNIVQVIMKDFIVI